MRATLALTSSLISDFRGRNERFDYDGAGHLLSAPSSFPRSFRHEETRKSDSTGKGRNGRGGGGEEGDGAPFDATRGWC